MHRINTGKIFIETIPNFDMPACNRRYGKTMVMSMLLLLLMIMNVIMMTMLIMIKMSTTTNTTVITFVIIITYFFLLSKMSNTKYTNQNSIFAYQLNNVNLEV